MGKVSIQAISHNFLVVSLRRATGELYCTWFKDLYLRFFYLSGLNWPVFNLRHCPVIYISILTFYLPNISRSPPSSTCINSSGYSTPLYGGFSQYFMLYWAWQFKPYPTLWAPNPPSKPFSGRKRGFISTLSLTPCGSPCTSAYGSSKYGKRGSSPSPPTHPGLPQCWASFGLPFYSWPTFSGTCTTELWV